ncbi:aminotransferase class V-fold PLP-dependent enzyme [Hyphobacterium sp.]|uniref:aminotransferase class V-fold PLP-dependent enzyme n=1 Tax=Hyphobacterium sp. TaxID=2004662 RepID=UPI003B522DB8
MTQTDFRSLFDFPRDFAYLNCAYMGPIPKASAQAGQEAYTHRQQPWTLDVQEVFFDRPEALRAHAAKLFGATADDVALMPAASYGLCTAAANLTLERGQDIVVLGEQFPSNVYVWRRKAEECGGQVRTVTRNDGQSWTEALLAAIGKSTGIVAVPNVHYSDGGRVDLAAVSDAARAAGAALVLDITQSLATGPFDLDRIQPDFAIAAGYKWLLAPYSIAYTYIAPQHQNGTPLEDGWVIREGAEDFSSLSNYTDRFAPGARRFDMGERGAVQTLPAALASLEWLNTLDMDWLQSQLRARTDHLAEAVAPFGAVCRTPDRSANILCLTLPDDAPADLAGRMANHGVAVSQRGPRLRVSPHIYNDEADLKRFITAVEAELG